MLVISTTLGLKLCQSLVDTLQILVGEFDTGRLGILGNSTRVAGTRDRDVLLINLDPFVHRFVQTHIRG